MKQKILPFCIIILLIFNNSQDIFAQHTYKTALGLRLNGGAGITIRHFKLLKTLQKQAEYSWHLSNLVSFIRLNLFVKIDLKKWLDKPFLDDDEIDKLELQLSLF